MRLKLVWLMFFVGVIAINQVAHAQVPTLSRMVETLQSKGVKTCAADLDKVVKWIHSDESKFANVTTWYPANPDKRSAFAATSERYSDGSMVTTFTASPDASGTCAISATQVFTSSKNCPSLREDVFKEWKFLLDMGASTAYERADFKESTVFVTPMPNGGCMVVKQTIFYYE